MLYRVRPFVYPSLTVHFPYSVTKIASTVDGQNYFTFKLKKVLFLWIIYFSYVLYFYTFVRVCLLMPCGHLLGKG